MNYLDLERVIVRRLVGLNVALPRRDYELAGRALEVYLGALGLRPRPVRWAADARAGRDAVRYADLRAPLEELDAALTLARRLNGESLGGRGGPAAWERGHEEIKEMQPLRLLDTVRRIVMRRAAVRHVPWLAYTGDEKTHPANYPRRREEDPAWEAARDTFYSIARDAKQTAASAPVSSFKERRLVVPAPVAEACVGMLDAFDSGLWLYWLTPDEVVAAPRPELQLERGRLHSARGPAISWPGGESYYFLHGAEVVREVVETPASLLDPRMILFERNAQARAEIVRKVGVERVCEALNARRVDAVGDYELLMLDLLDGRERPYLKMRNPSVPGVYHIEGVAPHCRTVAEALAWRNGTDVPPSLLT
jgi:hypothetical protein